LPPLDSATTALGSPESTERAFQANLAAAHNEGSSRHCAIALRQLGTKLAGNGDLDRARAAFAEAAGYAHQIHEDDDPLRRLEEQREIAEALVAAGLLADAHDAFRSMTDEPPWGTERRAVEQLDYSHDRGVEFAVGRLLRARLFEEAKTFALFSRTGRSPLLADIAVAEAKAGRTPAALHTVAAATTDRGRHCARLALAFAERGDSASVKTLLVDAATDMANACVVCRGLALLDPAAAGAIARQLAHHL
jgi:hypothetical protein